jgi:Flp pilus assembly protein TadG
MIAGIGHLRVNEASEIRLPPPGAVHSEEYRFNFNRYFRRPLTPVSYAPPRCGILAAWKVETMCRFLRDDLGVVAILFGLLLIPLVGMVGLALDYARATNALTQLQAALDATALAAARADSDMSEEELATFAADYLASNYAGNTNYDYTLESIRREDGRVVLSATGNVPTTLFALLGIDTMPISTQTEVAWSIGKLEIALVLDNTGSMSRQNRMGALKDASHVLLDMLERQAVEPDYVRLSIVPFDQRVKVDPQFATASWLQPLPGMGPDPCAGLSGLQRLICLIQNSGPGGTVTWDGCIEDRNQPYDVSAAPVTSQNTRYPAIECDSGSTLATVQPLTDDFDLLRGRIDAMQPNGWTNITIGMAWGLNTLLDHEPFTGAVPTGTENVTKIMILMTDGENTRNRWSNSSGAIDARTRLACDAVKNPGILLYTVRFMEGSQSLLRDCATRPDMFYDVNSVNQLRVAFEGIAAQISQLRLSR